MADGIPWLRKLEVIIGGDVINSASFQGEQENMRIVSHFFTIMCASDRFLTDLRVASNASLMSATTRATKLVYDDKNTGNRTLWSHFQRQLMKSHAGRGKLPDADVGGACHKRRVQFPNGFHRIAVD